MEVRPVAVEEVFFLGCPEPEFFTRMTSTGYSELPNILSLSKNKTIAIVLCMRTGAKPISDQPTKIERKIVRSLAARA